jgi:hypothetical protein
MPFSAFFDALVQFRQSTRSINHFVGNDTWNYYFVCINGTDIMVEKGADYRICEWYVMKQKEHDNPDSYSSRIHRTVGDISNY